jgi:hypothetical protein
VAFRLNELLGLTDPGNKREVLAACLWVMNESAKISLN